MGFGVLPDQQAFGGLPNAMLAFHTFAACTAPSEVFSSSADNICVVSSHSLDAARKPLSPPQVG
ncbi:MAG: hypothetical protein K5884_00355 [Ruminococcus sp.]|nr:hypothetical protein [Ruminococcus sp.]